MGEGNDMALGYMMGQDSGGSGGNGGGWGMGDGGIWALLILALLFGRGGFGFGGNGGGGNGGGYAVPYNACCCDGGVRSAISEGFALNNITDGIRGIQQGICDSTYALNNSIMTGFHGVDNAVCTLGYQTQQGFNSLGYALKDCCCETQRLIERGFCDVGYAMATNTNNIIQSSHSDTDRVIAKLDAMENARMAEKLDALRTENLSLRFAASQANQNAFITANQEAQTATLLRRLGADCPTAAYLVQPPTPINFPTNGCGTVQFSGWNGGNGCGCGCGG